VASVAGMTARVGVATAYFGANQAPANFDVSKCLFASLIEGVFTDGQALTYARWLKDVFNLPINI